MKISVKKIPPLSGLYLNNDRHNAFGFTLAEVLITLGIIGIVAAMTIPTLINNYQKAQTLSALKKSYTNLAQAVKQSEIDNGPSQNWDWGTNITFMQSFNTYWAPYLKVTKYCYAASDCGYAYGNVKDSRGLYAGNNILFVSAATVTVLLNDGSVLRIRNSGTGDYIGNFILVDLNAGKEPNTLGKDVFLFAIDPTGKGVLPRNTSVYGPSTTSENCMKVANGGELCAEKIMLDNWQIKSDYPW